MNHLLRTISKAKLVALAACCIGQHVTLADANSCVDAPRAVSERATAQGINHCPVADAGLDALTSFDQALTLDASQSTDLDGDALRYAWRMVSAPLGSGAVIATPNAVRTQFTPDLPGDYTLELSVKDARGALSTDVLNISTRRTAPVANAGSDVTAAVGSLVDLDAIGSFDVDGSDLSYRWHIVEMPMESKASLSSSEGMQSGLQLDAEGDYVVQLIVSDGSTDSVADTMRISTRNTQPLAHAGRARTLAPGSTLQFDGSASTDVDRAALRYEWSVLSAPDGATVELKGADQATPSTYLTETGLYVFQLVTNDGELFSAPDTVLIEIDDQRIQVNPDDYKHLSLRGGGDDEDGDGVIDADDNCVLASNSDQRDTDGDGIGNACDPDLNNDGVVNVIDLGILRSVFFTNDPDADLNGDGVVNVIDLGIMRSRFFLPPGPAGTIIWISLVDGDFANRLNWQPQIVPSAGSLALIDVGPAVNVTATSDNIVVKGLVNNETLTLFNTTFTATDALENGGTIDSTQTTINDTQIIPSQAGSGDLNVLSNNTWRSITLGIDTVLSNNVNIILSDRLTVDATFTINAPSSPTGITGINDLIIDGSGTIAFNGVGNSQISEPRILPNTLTTTTFGPNLTLRGGKGTIGRNTADVVFNSTAIADISGETLRFVSSGLSGAGIIAATNGGGIEFQGTIDNAGNAFSIDGADGSVRFITGANVRNTNLSMTPGTNAVFPSGTYNFQNVLINGDLTVENNSNINVLDGLTLNGNAQINAPTSPTGFLFNNTQTLGGNAIITLNGVGNSQVSEPRLFPVNGTTLTIAPTVTVRGGKGTIGQTGGSLVFEGVLSADVDGEQLVIGGLNWSSNSSMSATNGGSIRFFGTMNNASQTLELDTTDGELVLTTGSQINNAIFNGTAGSTLRVPTGSSYRWTSNVMNIDVSLENAANINVFAGLTLNGDMLITAPVSPTGLLFNDTQLLDGTGTITIDGTGNSVIAEPRLFPFNGTTTTVGAGITVRGGNGTIGQTGGNLVFNGTLISDRDGLFLDIGGLLWSSSQQLQGINGGNILMFGALDNGAGAFGIDNPGGETRLRAGGTLRNATINGTPGTNIEMLGTTNLDAMVINADVTHNNAANSNVLNGLTLNGTATINAPVSPTGYLFTNTQSLLGNATFVINSESNSSITEPRLFPFNGTTLTLGPNVRIEGGDGTIGQGGSTINFGAATVDANITDKALQILGNWTATGTMRASNGGEVRLGGTLDNAAASFTLDVAGGSATMLNGANLRNATINGTAGSVMTANVSGTFQALTYTGDLVMNNGHNITVTDGLTINGTATINAPTSPTGLLFANDQTLGGNLNVVFNGIGNSSISEPRLFPFNGTTLTIGPNVAVSGGVGTIGQAGANTILQGSITADTGRLVVTNPAPSPLGSFAARGGNTLTVTGTLDAPGSLVAGPDSVIDVSGLISMSAGTTTTIEVNSATATGRLEGNTIVHGGTLNMSAVDGYSPAGGEMFDITGVGIAAGGSGAFATVNSLGLSGGQSFGVTYNADGEATATVN
ncbi:MAG: PKD domain-containing protein [Gammaproteobacteria bacterium]